ncbi:MAG: hypothetical protein NTV21_16460 [Planctomycetota bacterium]|nr:hypothetical protein [Planctomycetota bacterium]
MQLPRLRPTLAALALAFVAACGKDAPAPSGPPPDPLREDGRVSYLLVPGPRSGHYDVDTSDRLAILAENLEHGTRDSLRRAREELGAAGPEGLEIVRRTIDAYFASPDGVAHLRNAIDVVQRSDAPGARELALRVLEHPDVGIASLAASALEKHGTTEDVDLLMARFLVADPEFKLKFFLAAAQIDPPRAQREVLAWIESGQYDGLWDECVTLLSQATAPDVVGRISALWRDALPRFRILLAAPCARAGDAEALEFLRGEARSSEQWRAELGVAALQQANLDDELDYVARKSVVQSARMRALNALATDELARRHIEAFRANLNEADSALSTAALAVLVRIGDSLAIDRAIELVGQDEGESLQTAMTALRDPVRKDPVLAERVFTALARRREPERTRALGDQMRTLQAIGQVPVEGAARALVELSRTAKGDVSNVRAARWLLQQAGNTGAAGQRVIYEELQATTDPVRRLDCLESLSAWGGPVAVELLIQFVESEQARPYELLYAADRLVKLGTVDQIAPVLKRVTLRVTQPDVRVALQSLLWTNYPPRSR